MEFNFFREQWVYQAVGIITTTYSFLQVVFNYQMGDKIKRALLWSCFFSSLVILGEVIFSLCVMWNVNSRALTILSMVKYILLSSLPVTILSALEREKYVHSTIHVIIMMMLGAYYMSIILNIFFPIYYTAQEDGSFAMHKLWWIHCSVMFTIYILSFVLIFNKKYTVSLQEVAGMMTLIILFFGAIYFTDIEFHPGVLELLCGLCTLVMTNMFQCLEAKVCPVSSLPYVNLLLAQKKYLRNKKPKRLAIFELTNLDNINEQYTRKRGDIYFYSVARTLYEKLKPYGSLYRCPGNKILFIGEENKKVDTALQQVEKLDNTSDKYGKYEMQLDTDSCVCDDTAIYELLKAAI